MPLILCIETATDTCSVCLSAEGQMIALAESTEKNAHASQITLLIDRILKEANLEVKALNAVAVSKGPGSYTGLRVGVSTAKGICYALGIPLIGINTLESLTAHFISSTGIHPAEDLALIPMLDARRMEVYCLVADHQLNILEPTQAKIIDEVSFHDSRYKKIICFGSGAAKCEEVMKHHEAIFVKDISCSSVSMCKPADEAFKAGKFENTGWFEPFYLKDFAGTMPKK